MSKPVTAAPLSTTSNYVLPAPPRQPGTFVDLAAGKAARTFRRGGEVAEALGQHFTLLSETQQMFLAEVRQRVEALDQSVAEASKAQLKGAIREVLGVLDWCDAVQADLVVDGRRAAAGAELVDVAALADEVAATARRAGSEVLVTGQLRSRWWGQSSLLAALLHEALALVAARTQGDGARLIEIDAGDGVPSIRVAGSGEPRDIEDRDLVARFRELSERLGARVVPDALGAGGIALVIELPAT